MTHTERKRIRKQSARRTAHKRDMAAAAHRRDRCGIKSSNILWTPRGKALRRLAVCGHWTVRDMYKDYGRR